MHSDCRMPWVRKCVWGLLMVGLLLGSYPFVVNRCAFYPDRRTVVPADALPANAREVFVETEDGRRLQCYWLSRPADERVVIYFHGNAGNIGHRLPELRILSDMGPNVLGVGYRGYGNSTGRPSEKGIYADGRAALDYVTRQLGYETGNIFLLGRSIGSTVAVDVARDHLLGGVILVTPLTSGRDMVRAHGLGFLAFVAGDKFNNMAKIDALRCPLLIIHGTDDTITPYFMGRRLYEQAPEPKQLVVIPGGGHNEIGGPGHEAYWAPIAAFLHNRP